MQGELPGEQHPFHIRADQICLRGGHLSAEVNGQRLQAEVMSYEHVDDEVRVESIVAGWLRGSCVPFVLVNNHRLQAEVVSYIHVDGSGAS